MENVLVQVRSLGNDEWSRPQLQNVKSGRIYADINLGVGRPDWHVLTTEGEPLTRIRPNVVFEIVH